MNILAVEEDWWDRKQLVRLLKRALPDMNICAFSSTAPALAFAKENPVGAAFIDLGRSIHIPGYFLAKNILEFQKTNIILTNYEWKHTQEAIELRVSGYIRKPLRYENIMEELENLRVPLAEAGQWRLAGANPPPKREKKRERQIGRLADSQVYFRRTSI